MPTMIRQGYLLGKNLIDPEGYTFNQRHNGRRFCSWKCTTTACRSKSKWKLIRTDRVEEELPVTDVKMITIHNRVPHNHVPKKAGKRKLQSAKASLLVVGETTEEHDRILRQGIR